MQFQIPKQQWNKIEDYLAGLPQEESPGLSVGWYLDLMERILEEYDLDDLGKAEEDIQSFSRIVSTLAVLLHQGRKQQLVPLWQDLMNQACAALPACRGDAKLDFSVKELTLAYQLMKEYDTNGDWAKSLSSVQIIDYVYQTGDRHNINLYNVAGEVLRTRQGLCDSREYISKCLDLQLAKLDENGMYPDNFPGEHNPVLYDLAARVQLQWAEAWGDYEFGDSLRRGGIWSLMTQSPTGQIPYGGRSNQYLFNETLFASMMEYEAGKQAEAGNFALAGRMRRSARLAAESVQTFLERHSHNRNLFSDPSAGCEEYGYFKKYMISAAAFLIGAVLFAREEIPEMICPCQAGGYVLSSGARFHQVFACCCGYGIQLDANGDPEYDATGLGRVHRAGAPAALGLSLPFAAQPHYTLPAGLSPLSAAIGIGWDDGEGGIQYLSDLTGLKHALAVEEEGDEKVKFTVTYTGNSLKNCEGVMETYTVDQGGLHYSAKLLESEAPAVYARVPLLVTDGARESKLRQRAGQCNVWLEDWRWRVTTNASLTGEEREVSNRNGVYRLVTFVRLEPKIRLNLSICQENNGE